MDIIIKSFNRPYYLDRCLNSIYKHVKGNFKITVLDDGTPEKYLNKIKDLYPEIEIILSENHNTKSKKINNHQDINGYNIPTNLWINTVKNAKDYVLVTEDDVWFVDDLNADEAIKEMQTNTIHLTKLGWLGKKSKSSIEEVNLSKEIVSTYPQNLFTSNQLIMDLFFYNKFKFFTILYKLGFVNNNTINKYWSLNSILMGLYHKDYWLYIWKDANEKVDELQQLRNASVWFNLNKKNKNIIAKTKNELLRTTFSSSATNSYHKYGIDIDMNKINQILNEAWLNDKLDANENYPNDFSEDYITSFIQEEVDIENWKKWVEKFKNQYRNVGAKVD